MKDHKITIHVNQRSFRFEITTLSPSDFRSAIAAPDDYEVWRAVHPSDPEGQLPVDDIQVTTEVAIENANWRQPSR